MKQRILFDKEMIAERVSALGKELSSFYADQPLTIVTLMNGAMLFSADLSRHIRVHDLYMDSFSVSSYRNDASTGELSIRGNLKLSVENRHVLLLDDILDTGFTLQEVKKHFQSLGAVSVRSCVLLEKQLAPSKTARKISADWVGFSVPDLYVIGYGLDSNELYRALPDIRVIEE